jgi:hypothetical protein
MAKYTDADIARNREIREIVREERERQRQEAKAQADLERKATRRRERKASGQKTPFIVKVDNFIHDIVGAPRNYDID